MRARAFLALLLPAFLGSCTGTRPPVASATPVPMATKARAFTYPAARKSDVVDDYHGTKVADPYRWLEDADSPESRAWIEAQNALTFGHLEKIPERTKLRERLTKLWNYERVSTPWTAGGRWFWSRNDGLQNQSVLFTASSPDAKPVVLFDPNALSTDGTVALSGTAISDDGKRMAYALSVAGSDWQEWRVRDIATGKDLPDLVKWAKFTGASWAADGSGFYYSRYPAPKAENASLKEQNYGQQVYFHRLGDTQEKDRLVFERPEHKEWFVGADVTEDGRFLTIGISRPSDIHENLFWYQDLKKKGSALSALIDEWGAQYANLGNDGSVFYFRTNLDAPRGRVIAIDLAKPDKKNWKELVPQSADKLDGVAIAGDTLFCAYLHDAHTVIKAYDLKGTFLRDVPLPGIGTSGALGGRRDQKEAFYSFTNQITPRTIYRYDLKTGASKPWWTTKVDFDSTPYVTEQVFVASKDGTKIPMFLTHRKDLTLDGNNPVWLDAYGGFNVSITPGFSVSVGLWLESGGVFAQANLRGGGEYGEEWHLAGTKERKQNVFDDFIATAEWLIANKWTKPSRLAIHGGSNGGLLMGAVMTQRPELFGAVIAEVGVLDMLRFQRFTIGWAWVGDYGSAEDPKMFPALYKYSPLHNLKPGTKYPATLLTTGDHDDRVFPAHTFKFTAALQAAQGGDAPVLVRIDTKAGHGGGKPTTKAIEETADRWAFTMKALGMTLP